MPDRTELLAVALADMPDVVAALLRDHVSDARGRCRECGCPGTGMPYLASPCSLQSLAQAARRIRVQRTTR